MPKQILTTFPKEFKARGYGVSEAVAIRCDCRSTFMWEKKRGNLVRCPTCKITEEMPITDAPSLQLTPGAGGSMVVA